MTPTRCVECANPEHASRMYPPGRYFSCRVCGKRFERIAGKTKSDAVFDQLLTPQWSTQSTKAPPLAKRPEPAPREQLGKRQARGEPLNPRRIVRDVIVIGGSAGAHDSIASILAAFPAGLPVIVGVVVHRGAHSFYDWSITLGRKSALKVREGAHGALLEKGCVYIAPSDQHMRFAGGRIHLACGPKEHFSRPAVDPLFASAAEEYGERVVGVVLSGGGGDGTPGLVEISRAGGLTLIQHPSEAESASMPQTAATHDHVQAALHVDEIGEVLIALARGAEIIPRSEGPAAHAQ